MNIIFVCKLIHSELITTQQLHKVENTTEINFPL